MSYKLRIFYHLTILLTMLLLHFSGRCELYTGLQL